VTSADDIVLQILLDHGLVSMDVLDNVRGFYANEADSSKKDTLVLERLIHDGHITVMEVLRALGREYGMEVVDLKESIPDPEAIAAISSDDVRKYRVLPLQIDGKELDLAVGDPFESDGVDTLGHVYSLSIVPFLADPRQIRQRIDELYKEVSEEDEEVNKVLVDLQDDQLEANISALAGANAEDEKEGPILRYVQSIITEALRRRASDIHLEPLERRFRVRYRIDGVLQEVENPPKRLQPSIISRIKIMANISIAEKRIPQDGRIRVVVSGKDIDLRVSSLPTAFGESIVMRILDKEGLKLGLPELGFLSDDQDMFEKLITLPDGILLVTGPTGSGKSTTLYSCLNYINHPDRKIITVEDPVEYQMSGINQVQVRREVGMGFAEALRAMLRQAPNIIMIGEIRDKETAEIAINASLTGHMVFSTLHTNDAPSAVSRLVDIGIKPFLVAASLRVAMAQRLVRQICSKCKVPYQPDLREISSIGMNEDQAAAAQFYIGKGCPHCTGTGYRGRKGIFEIFVVKEEIEQMIYDNASIVDLRRKARELGMRSMREDGIRKILTGVTTIPEVVGITIADEI
jgi:type IV pilus assembly protein PilB